MSHNIHVLYYRLHKYFFLLEMDLYCCVAYMENGQKRMSTVPANWIINEIWPLNGTQRLLKSRATPQESWLQIPNDFVLFSGTPLF